MYYVLPITWNKNWKWYKSCHHLTVRLIVKLTVKLNARLIIYCKIIVANSLNFKLNLLCSMIILIFNADLLILNPGYFELFFISLAYMQTSPFPCFSRKQGKGDVCTQATFPLRVRITRFDCIYILSDVLVCSIAVYFYESCSILMSLYCMVSQNTKWRIKMYSDTTH